MTNFYHIMLYRVNQKNMIIKHDIHLYLQVLQKSLTTEDQILHEAEETVKQPRFLHDM
jgi:hypothetical protein